MAELFRQPARGPACGLGGLVEAGGFLRQRLAQQGHVVARPLGGERGLVDVVAQGLQHLARLLGGQRRRRDQRLGQAPGPAGFGRQPGALPDRMGHHDGEPGRGEGDQGVDRQP